MKVKYKGRVVLHADGVVYTPGEIYDDSSACFEQFPMFFEPEKVVATKPEEKEVVVEPKVTAKATNKNKPKPKV